MLGKLGDIGKKLLGEVNDLTGGLLGGKDGKGGGLFGALLGLVANMIVPGSGALFAGAGSLLGSEAGNALAASIGQGMSSLG